jgi:hypothetical protein
MAGAPASENRLADFETFCQGGEEHGNSCASHPDCPNGRCRIRASGGIGIRPLRFHATLIVDDDASEFDGSEELQGVVTVTAILEFIAQGRRQVLAQTYENLKGADFQAIVENLQQGVEIADLPDRDRRLDEALLNASFAENGIADDFLFQSPDGEMQEALRSRFDTDGNFVVSRVRGINKYANHGEDALASVIEVVLDVIVTPAG